MSSDEACDTGLGLSLASCLGDHKAHNNIRKKVQLIKYNDLVPSLSLGRPFDHAASNTEEGDAAAQNLQVQDRASSPYSGAALSSFSNSSSFKRDRDLGGEEVEVEKVVITSSSRASEELYDQDQETSPRKKLRLSKQQSATLEDSFKEHTTLNPKQKQELARKLNLRPRQVEVWFQNRRARTKLKQTEADCELLKKCCETLKEENKRLHKELQELKLMKQNSAAAASPPFYMQFPTMCPSCEKICNGGDHHKHQGSPASRFLIGSKPAHLIFNPFTTSTNSTHPSTAC